MSPTRKSLLRLTLEEAMLDGWSMKDLTVLSHKRDPFRLDTPANHELGEWLRTWATEIWDAHRRIHLRGLHYLLVSKDVLKPNGERYANNDQDWGWLQDGPAKMARWLGYVPFDSIVDARNAEPLIVVREDVTPEAQITAGAFVDIPDVDDFVPQIQVSGFDATQPYRIVMFGEKTSLDSVLAPLADTYNCDLYLPSGEISDTLLYGMARTAHEDGRPMVVLTFSDSDPAGWQMPISIARKLQAFKAVHFEDLDFRVHRVALTPTHVREHDLPDTPLKDTERRANDWTRTTGTRQTEIDALVQLQPELLTAMARRAIREFYDTSLDRRVREARQQWIAEAQAALDAGMTDEDRQRIHDQITERIDEVREQIEALNESLAADVPDVDLPEIVVPHPEMGGKPTIVPLIDSEDPWAEQTRGLVVDRAYGEEDG